MLKINEELRELIPPLSTEEKQLYERAKLALKLKPIYEQKAKENHSRAVAESNINRENPYHQKSDNMECSSINTKRELAKMAGVSHDTIMQG